MNNSEWTWGIGVRRTSSPKHYDFWASHPEWELHWFWDEGGEHTVHLLEYDSEASREDEKTAEYPTERGTFDTEEEAEEYALELMSKYE